MSTAYPLIKVIFLWKVTFSVDEEVVAGNGFVDGQAGGSPGVVLNPAVPIGATKGLTQVIGDLTNVKDILVWKKKERQGWWKVLWRAKNFYFLWLSCEKFIEFERESFRIWKQKVQQLKEWRCQNKKVS